MISVRSVLFTLVLFSELSGNMVTVAMPAAKLEVGETEQEGLDLIRGDEPMVEPVVFPPVYRRSLLLDNTIRDEDESPKALIISDMRLKGHSVRGLTPAFTRSSIHTPAEYSLKIDRRDTDLDMLRCMIGRVYRPCWEA
uniref:Pro-MCH 2-like n=1 Tax=Acanthochromis polyacanthus TaxID=80966 RepID=A0A3Q1EDI6_9TELE